MDAPAAPGLPSPPLPLPITTRPSFRWARTPRPIASSSAMACGVEKAMGEEVVVVPGEALRALAEAAFTDINHLLRPAHLAQLRAILDDPEASDNDNFVAFDFLKNANIAAGGVLPMCQDTGTAIIVGKKGRLRLDRRRRRSGARRGRARRLHQEEPALLAARTALDVRGEEHQEQHAGAGRDLCRGRRPCGRSTSSCSSPRAAARRTRSFLFQATPSILDPRAHARRFLKEKVLTLGTAACPPYHLAIVIGGTSAELTMKTVKLASTKYYDSLPTPGSRGRPRLPRPRHGARDPLHDRSRSASARSSAANISATTCG